MSCAVSAAGYSKDALVIEKLNTDVTFAADGTLVWEQSLVVRVQPDAGVRRFGVLTFPYSGANERIELVYVRVRKPDGRVVETPEASVQDIRSGIARSAPTYSDLREKQVPVKGLGTGEVLEYRVKDAIVLEETLRIERPSGLST